LGLQGCGSTQGGSREKVIAPEDMPDICQDIDFEQAGADLKQQCGVQTRVYRSYKNIPEHRNLLLPKGAKIVRKGKDLELRLQSTLPIDLPEDWNGKIMFDERMRRTFIKSRMDYCEFFPNNSTERLRILKLDIPLDIGGEATVCYTVASGPTTVQRKAGYAGRLELLDCADFLRLKAMSQTTEGDNSEDKPASDTTITPLQKGGKSGAPILPGGGKGSRPIKAGNGEPQLD
jgi:hypothetical protein